MPRKYIQADELPLFSTFKYPSDSAYSKYTYMFIGSNSDGFYTIRIDTSSNTMRMEMLPSYSPVFIVKIYKEYIIARLFEMELDSHNLEILRHFGKDNRA